MSMEVVEEVMGSSNDHVHIVKGKRTKRQRPSSPLAAAALDNMMTTSNSSSGEGGGYDAGGSDGGGGAAAAGDGHSYQSPTNSAELGDSTEEEEDMANCLILLAQGHSLDNSKQIEGGLTEKFVSRRFSSEAPMATTTSNKAGFYLYQCKTCSRCFPSFQALGGHRASHKKPKAAATLPAGEKKTLMLLEDEHNLVMNRSSSNNHHHHHSLNLQMGNRASGYSTSTTSNNKSKVHECSICGTEFSSGQALGGHMRRHRSSTTAAASMTTNTASMETLMMTESQDAKKQRTVLSLDLNLPAPEEERDSKFQFPSKQQSLVFSASSLVDCHY